MSKRQLFDSDLSRHLIEPDDAEQADTILMSGSGAEQVFDDLRQRYERRVESQEHRLLAGRIADPAPLEGPPRAPARSAGPGPAERTDPSDRGDRTDSALTLEPASPAPLPDNDVPWYAWALVIASFVLLAVAATILVLIS